MPRKKTHEEFVQEVKDKYGDQYEILGTYDGCDKKVKVRHNACGTEWDIRPNDLLKKERCPVCGKEKLIKSLRKDKEVFKKEFYEVSNGEYELLSEYVKDEEKVRIKHLGECNKEFLMTPSKFLKGQRCPHCNRNFLKSREEIAKNISEKYNGEFELVGDRHGADRKVHIRHKVCGTTHYVGYYDFMSGRTFCKTCNASSLESLTEKFLIENNIKYESQKTFENLVGIKGCNLSYDFYINDYNILIELQGEQHEKPVKHFGGEEKFKRQQEHDRRKREYAKKHNIKLIEIWYYEVNRIEEILRKEIPAFL